MNVRFNTMVLSCAERAETLKATLRGLRAAGWSDAPLVVLDDGIGSQPIDRIHRTWRRMVRYAAEADTDFVLLLEDDLVFGKWFTHNLTSWAPLHRLAPSRAFYASLYNPNRPFLAKHEEDRYLVADPRYVWGAQALVVTPQIARFIDAHWDAAPGNPDMRMPRIASQVTSIYYHVPSLVDHAPVATTWGGMEHSAFDFDPEWRAPQS
jgi:hypothetical protein